MKHKYLDVFLGLFVLAGLAVAGYMIIEFGGMAANRYDVTVEFDFVEALIQEAPVYYAGVECGKVKRIIPWGEDEGRTDISKYKVKVVMSVDEGTTIWDRDEVKVAAISLLGEKAIEMTPTITEEGRRPPDARRLPKDGSAVMVGTNPEGLLAPVRELLGPLAEEETQEEIRNIFRSFSVLMDNLNQLTGDELRQPLSDTVQDLSLAVNDFRTALADFRRGVRTIAGAGQEAQKLLAENRGQISGLLTSMDEALNSLDRVVDGLYPIVADIRAGRGGLGKFVSDQTWYTNFNEVLKGLRAYSLVGWKGDKEFAQLLEQQQRQAKQKPVVWVR